MSPQKKKNSIKSIKDIEIREIIHCDLTTKLKYSVSLVLQTPSHKHMK